MSLTPEGEVYLEHARRILGDIDDLDQLLSEVQGHAQGPVARECHAGLRPHATSRR